MVNVVISNPTNQTISMYRNDYWMGIAIDPGTNTLVTISPDYDTDIGYRVGLAVETPHPNLVRNVIIGAFCCAATDILPFFADNMNGIVLDNDLKLCADPEIVEKLAAKAWKGMCH